MLLIELRHGASRLVFLVGGVALKFPCIKRKSVLTRWGQVQQGRNCNRAERAAWRAGKFPHLCPILWADRFGWIVVMRDTPIPSGLRTTWAAGRCAFNDVTGAAGASS